MGTVKNTELIHFQFRSNNKNRAVFALSCKTLAGFKGVLESYSHIRLNFTEYKDSQGPLASHQRNKMHLKNIFTMKVDIKSDDVRKVKFHNLMVELSCFNDTIIQWLPRYICSFWWRSSCKLKEMKKPWSKLNLSSYFQGIED